MRLARARVDHVPVDDDGNRNATNIHGLPRHMDGLGGPSTQRGHNLINSLNDFAVVHILILLELQVTYLIVIGMNRSSFTTARKLSRLAFDKLNE